MDAKKNTEDKPRAKPTRTQLERKNRFLGAKMTGLLRELLSSLPHQTRLIKPPA